MPAVSAPLARLGLTGGIGAGKSAVAAIWRSTGLRVIDLDAHSRAVLDVPGDGVEEAVARFGEEYRAAGGTIDRAALARLVFADADARADLETIVLTRVDAAVAGWWPTTRRCCWRSGTTRGRGSRRSSRCSHGARTGSTAWSATAAGTAPTSNRSWPPR